MDAIPLCRGEQYPRRIRQSGAGRGAQNDCGSELSETVGSVLCHLTIACHSVRTTVLRSHHQPRKMATALHDKVFLSVRPPMPDVSHSRASWSVSAAHF